MLLPCPLTGSNLPTPSSPAGAAAPELPRIAVVWPRAPPRLSRNQQPRAHRPRLGARSCAAMPWANAVARLWTNRAFPGPALARWLDARLYGIAMNPIPNSAFGVPVWRSSAAYGGPRKLRHAN
jgi:hypothetical protein